MATARKDPTASFVEGRTPKANQWSTHSQPRPPPEPSTPGRPIPGIRPAKTDPNSAAHSASKIPRLQIRARDSQQSPHAPLPQQAQHDEAVESMKLKPQTQTSQGPESEDVQTQAGVEADDIVDVDAPVEPEFAHGPDVAAELARAAVAVVVEAVAGHVAAGQIRSSRPKPVWQPTSASGSASASADQSGGEREQRLDRLNAQKRSERVTRLLQSKDPEEELIKLGQELAQGRDKAAVAAAVAAKQGSQSARGHKHARTASVSAAEVMQEDVAELARAREARDRLLRLRHEEEERKSQRAEHDRLRREQFLLDLTQQNEARLRFENDLIRVRESKEAERQARVAARDEERRQAKELERAAREVIAQKQREREVPLWKQMEQAYKDQFVQPELEKRQQRLAEIREQRTTPLDMASLREHELKVMHAEASRRQQAQAQDEPESEPRFAPSALLKQVLEHDAMVASEESRVKREVAERKERERKYSDLVREMFPPPPVDAAKLEEERKLLEQRKRPEPQPVKSMPLAEIFADARKVKVGERKPTEAVASPRRARLRTRNSSPTRAGSGPGSGAGGEQPDYIAEMRTRRQQAQKHSPAPPDRATSMASLESRAREIERRAERQERKLRLRPAASAPGPAAGLVHGPVVHPEAAEKVSDMYIEAIKTKLQLFDVQTPTPSIEQEP